MTSAPPTEWKSARWWQNRPLEERLAWANFPPRWKDAQYEESLISDKTFNAIAVSILRDILTNKSASGRFITADRYVEMLKDQFDNDNELPEMYSMPHIVKYLKGVFDIVVLDAVGDERSTEFSQHEIGSLLRRRNEDLRKTIITTNLSPTEFIRRYGERVATVLEDMTISTVS
jgi:DNA replication protein DnaC